MLNLLSNKQPVNLNLNSDSTVGRAHECLTISSLLMAFVCFEIKLPAFEGVYGT